MSHQVGVSFDWYLRSCLYEQLKPIENELELTHEGHRTCQNKNSKTFENLCYKMLQMQSAKSQTSWSATVFGKFSVFACHGDLVTLDTMN